MKMIPIVERRYHPGLRYQLGCAAIRLIGRIASVDIDFQPLALPGDRLTGYVNCPACGQLKLVTVSLFNEARHQCRSFDCSRWFETMNDGVQIWLLNTEGAQ